MAEAKKKNWFARALGGVCRYFRELRSELKKVVWPTPKQVAKNTLIVLACVAVVLVIVGLFDIVAAEGINGLINLISKLKK